MEYHIAQLETPVPIAGLVDQLPWSETAPLTLTRYMGHKPRHFPRTTVKMLYEPDAVRVLFHVEDHYIRAVAEEHQGPVWQDSCAEFFFTPGPDVTVGYFNVEMNCGGTMLFHFQKRSGNDKVVLPNEVCEQVETYHSMPKIVEPEISEPTTWILEYRLPITVLANYCPVVRPAPGVTWRANFNKCADLTSGPHWLTWAPIDHPEPMFHAPHAFGTLVFD